MARQQRSTTVVQESTHPIAQVALYARVSTLNNQDLAPVSPRIAANALGPKILNSRNSLSSPSQHW
jgi:hypothetical protein